MRYTADAPDIRPFPRIPSGGLTCLVGLHQIVSTPNPADDRRMRALLSTCFTPTALQSQEPTIISHVDKVIKHLRRHCGGQDQDTTTVNIVKLFSFVAFGIIGDLGLGKTFHSLDNNGPASVGGRTLLVFEG